MPVESNAKVGDGASDAGARSIRSGITRMKHIKMYAPWLVLDTLKMLEPAIYEDKDELDADEAWEDFLFALGCEPESEFRVLEGRMLSSKAVNTLRNA